MKRIDYYYSPASPWTYLGHARFAAIARKSGAVVDVKPADYGVIFPQSGGLPLGKRAPQRQAYRLVELERWKNFHGLPLTLHPRFFPVDGTAAACLVGGAAEALRLALAGDLMRAVWAEERDIADPAALAEIAAPHGITDVHSMIGAGKARYQQWTQEAVALGVFGAPTYVYRGELFWGQDRLDFLERALAAD